MRKAAAISAVVACAAAGPAFGQGADAAAIARGHTLAIKICAVCHVAAPDQARKPLLQPPAPSFAAIAARPDFAADRLAAFIKTTHRGLDSPKGMPNPDLGDDQVKDVVAYLMSLKK